jgi:hypothetical protein
VAPCQSAISAKIQADHGTQGHFTDHTTIARDMLGNARVQGSGGYLGTSFTFTCVIDEHTKTVALAFYDEHVDAYDDFRIVRDNLNGGHRTTLNRPIPFCMFTDPELARVGMNESEVEARGSSIGWSRFRCRPFCG